MVLLVGDVEDAAGIQGKARRERQPSVGRLAAVAGKAPAQIPGRPAPRDRVNPAVRPDAADPVIQSVGHVEVPRRVQRDGPRKVEPRGRRWPAVPGEPALEVAGGAAPGHGRDGPVPGHPPDAVVEAVGDVQAAARADGQAEGASQPGRRRRAAIPGQAALEVAGGAAPGHGRDGPVRRHLPHAVVVRVRDVEAARPVERQTGGKVQLCLRGRAAIAVETFGPVPGHGGDGAVRRDSPDAIVSRIGDEEVSGGTDGDRARRIELGVDRPAAVPGEPAPEVAGLAAPGDGRDVPRSGDLPDPVIPGVRDVQVAGAVDGEPLGAGQSRPAGSAPIARETLVAGAGERRDRARHPARGVARSGGDVTEHRQERQETRDREACGHHSCPVAGRRPHCPEPCRVVSTHSSPDRGGRLTSPGGGALIGHRFSALRRGSAVAAA